MGIFLEEMVLDFPRVIDADTVSELDLFQRLAIDAMLRVGVPRPWNLVFVEDAKLHPIISCGAGPSLRYATRHRSTRFSSHGRISG